MPNQPAFDVFLAYNSQDMPQVRTLVQELRKRGLRPWIDEEQVPPGQPFQDVIQLAIANVRAAIILIGSGGLGQWQIMELRSITQQAIEAHIPVIPVLLPGIGNIPDGLLFLKQFNWVKFNRNVAEVEALDRLEWGITGHKPNPQVEQHLDKTVPKPGTQVSRPISRQQFLKWGIPAGVGIVGVTIASQFLNLSEIQPLTSEPPKSTPTSETSSSTSNSSQPSDYSRLETLLKAGHWKEADQETVNLMLKVANKEGEGWLDSDDIRNFPCDALSKIDQLWVQNSPDGKFGFSVQAKIYVEDCGGNPNGRYDEQAWKCFGRQVGWRVNGRWIAYRDVAFDTSAPTGHLPFGERSGWSAIVWGFTWEVFFAPLLVQRLTGCDIK